MAVDKPEHRYGTYAEVIPSDDTIEKLAYVLSAFGVENPVPANSLHTTVIYSRVSCPEIEELDFDLPVTGSADKFEVFDNDDGRCLVLRIDSPALTKLHNRMRNEFGASHDFDKYRPHITLSYDFGLAVPPEEALVFLNNLVFDKFSVEELDKP